MTKAPRHFVPPSSVTKINNETRPAIRVGATPSDHRTELGHVTVPDVCVNSSTKEYALSAGGFVNVNVLFALIALVK